jgi:hypothetical protein
MKLQAKLDAYKRNFLKTVPEDAVAVIHRATEDLRNSGILARAVQVGDMAPDFALQNIDEKMVSLSGVLEKGPVVLGFYRGRW